MRALESGQPVEAGLVAPVMADGGGEGNFRYDLSADGGAYRLTGYGRDGRILLELSGGTDTSV